MITKYVNYRKEKKGLELVNMHTHYKEEFEYLESGLYNTDKEGCPVYIERFGKSDFKNLFKKSNLSKMENFYCL